MTGRLSLAGLWAGFVWFALGFCVHKFFGALLKKKKPDIAQKNICGERKKEEETSNCDVVSQSELLQNQKDGELSESDGESDRSVQSEEDESIVDKLASVAFRPALINILNQCDPVSFIRIARTCTKLRTICLNSRGIRINFPCLVVKVKDIFDTVDGIRFKYLKGKDGYLTVYGGLLRNLVKLPFHFEICVKLRNVWMMDPTDFSAINTFISQLPNYSIRKLFADNRTTIGCWPVLLSFVKAHNVKRFKYEEGYIPDRENVLSSLLRLEFDKITIANKLPSGILREIRAKEARLTQSDITVEDFTDLVYDVARGNLDFVVEWVMDHLNDNLGSRESFYACFADFTEISSQHKGPIPASRPLIILEHNVCYMLTSHHKVFCFLHSTEKNLAMVVAESIHDVPEVLHSILPAEYHTPYVRPFLEEYDF